MGLLGRKKKAPAKVDTEGPSSHSVQLNPLPDQPFPQEDSETFPAYFQPQSHPEQVDVSTQTEEDCSKYDIAELERSMRVVISAPASLQQFVVLKIMFGDMISDFSCSCESESTEHHHDRSHSSPAPSTTDAKSQSTPEQGS